MKVYERKENKDSKKEELLDWRIIEIGMRKKKESVRQVSKGNKIERESMIYNEKKERKKMIRNREEKE